MNPGLGKVIDIHPKEEIVKDWLVSRELRSGVIVE